MEKQFLMSINENGEGRWNLHPLHLKFCLNRLRESGKFADCFIFVEGRTIPCHRIILSMFSPYFEVLLSENYDKQPAIILNDDVTYQDAEDLMKFIYTGEVTIDPTRIAHFTDVCIKFKIVGFSFASDSSVEVDSPKRAGSLKEPQVATAEQTLDENPKKSRKPANVFTDVNSNTPHRRTSLMKAASSKESDKSNQKYLKMILPKLKLVRATKDLRAKGRKSLTPLTPGTLLTSRRASVFPSEAKLLKKAFPCPFCVRSYNSRNSLNRHRRECKSNPDPAVKECPTCHEEMTPSAFTKHKSKCNQRESRCPAGPSNKENEK